MKKFTHISYKRNIGKTITLFMCICIILGGCSMPKTTNDTSKTTAEKFEEVDSLIHTNVSAAFEKGLEEKYGEKFIVNKEKSAAPTMMYPTYRTEASPESNPELTFKAESTTLKDGVALNIQDGYLTRKFIPDEQALIDPILSQYFSEYRCLGGLGQIYDPYWMDGNTTFEEYFDYYSKKNAALRIYLPNENITPEYIDEIAPEMALKLQEIYPVGSLNIYIMDNLNQEDEKLSYKTKTIYWGREEE